MKGSLPTWSTLSLSHVRMSGRGMLAQQGELWCTGYDGCFTGDGSQVRILCATALLLFLPSAHMNPESAY